MNNSDLMLDVNVMLNILLQRDDYLEEVKFIKQFQNLYVSILSINNIFYICRKEQNTIPYFYEFMDSLTIVDANQSDYQKSKIIQLVHNDLEDCLLLAGCQRNKIVNFVTNDKKLLNLAAKNPNLFDVNVLKPVN